MRSGISIRFVKQWLILTCDRCGTTNLRETAGQKEGDTCGAPLPVEFKPLDDEVISAEIARMRLGLPSEQMVAPRCLGTLKETP